jgi:hypothetical protein
MPLISQPTSDETFIRFVVGTDDDDAGSLEGLFSVARLLRDDQKLELYEVDWLDQVYAWFNAELPCPPFIRQRFPADAVSWFRSSASRYISSMWDLAALLREHGQPIRMLRSDRPGTIIYEDPFQVVAARWRRRPRKRI